MEQHQENLSKAPDAEAAASSARKKRSRSSSSKQPAGFSRAIHAAGKLHASTMHFGFHFSLAYADYCKMPFTLKAVVVEEYERIAKPSTRSYCEDDYFCRRLVHRLPAPVTVRKVLRHFGKKKLNECKSAVEPSSLTAGMVRNFVQGLTQIFEVALPVCLLYPLERPQYTAIVTGDDRDKKDLVDVYGCEYLLRLFVRLPILLQHPSTPEEWSPAVIGPLLTDLLVLMQKNRQTLFPMTAAAGINKNTNYRSPLPAEMMDWERELYGEARSPTMVV